MKFHMNKGTFILLLSTMKRICQTLALLVGFAAITAPTLSHLGPTAIFLCKVGYNILTITVWIAFLFLIRKAIRSGRKDSSCAGSILMRWVCAAVFAFLVFGITLSVKQFAYGPSCSVPGRPMFASGWPIPWKWETQEGLRLLPWVMAVDAWCCFGLSLFLFGFRRIKSFAVSFLTPLLISLLLVLVTGNATRAINFCFPDQHVKATDNNCLD